MKNPKQRASALWFLPMTCIFLSMLFWACIDQTSRYTKADHRPVSITASVDHESNQQASIQSESEIVQDLPKILISQESGSPISIYDHSAPLAERDSKGTEPFLDGVEFIPSASITWDSSCETTACVSLEWYVCDLDNDLLGGNVYFYLPGGTNPFVLFPAGSAPWSDYGSVDVAGCDPDDIATFGGPFIQEFLIPESTFTGDGTYYFQLNFIVSDAEGNEAIPWPPIELTVEYETSSDCNGCENDQGECGCLIDMGGPDPECIWPGLVNPDDECKECNFSANPTGWSDRSGSCDDEVWCNGDDTCAGGECTVHAGDPCPDDGIFCNGAESCDEVNDICIHDSTPEELCPDDGLWCTGVEICCDGDAGCGGIVGCTNSAVPDCSDDGLFCNGNEFCDEANQMCDSTGDPCVDDGLFCNGLETCDEDEDECVHANPPCPDDGVLCNGIEVCFEAEGYCEIQEACPDDNVHCNGVESCNVETDACESSGDPCFQDEWWCNGVEQCDELLEDCVHANEPCADDGLFCNGTEFCDEQGDVCEQVGVPCIEDGILCNGITSCNEIADQCVIDDPCPDNGLWCDGDEACNIGLDECESIDEPCLEGEICIEDSQECLASTSGPVLSGAEWIPDLIDWFPECEWSICTQLEWYVCDQESDIIGGDVFFYESGTDNQTPWLSFGSLAWADLIVGDPGDISDCGNPYGPVVLELYFPETMFGAADIYYADFGLRATDLAGNWGNRLDNILLEIHYGVPTMTTTSTSTTTTIMQTNPPELFDLELTVPEFDWSASCATSACTQIRWWVCDVENDLEGGDIWIYEMEGFLDPVMTVPWSDVVDFPIDASDCGIPFGPVAYPILVPESAFTDGAGRYIANIEIEAGDAAGNVSDRTDNVVLVVNYDGPGSTTTTTLVGTTTTTGTGTTTSTGAGTTTTTGVGTTTTVETTTTTTTTTITVNNPVISNAAWSPSIVPWSENCAVTPCTQLQWSVCDPDNNLENGQVFISDSNEFLNSTVVPWTDLVTFPIDASDCENPYGPVAWDLVLPESLFLTKEQYIVSAQLYVTDEQGNESNVLTDISLQIDYGTTTTTTASTTTTTMNADDDDTADDDTSSDDDGDPIGPPRADSSDDDGQSDSCGCS